MRQKTFKLKTSMKSRNEQETRSNPRYCKKKIMINKMKIKKKIGKQISKNNNIGEKKKNEQKPQQQ